MSKSLTKYKWKAYLAGKKQTSWLRFREQSGLGYTEFNDGELAEIVIMFGLGFVNSWDNSISAWCSTTYDNLFKTDVVVRRNNVRANLQIKFNNFTVSQDSLPSRVILVELCPDPSYRGPLFAKDFEYGNEALARILVTTGFFDLDDIYSLMDNHKKNIVEIDKAWASIGN